MKKWVYALPLLVLACAQAQAADAAAGKEKSVLCAGCHGPDGKSPNPLFPHLAGQNEAYLLKQIKAFKDGSRPEPTMVPFMAALTEADMENLAAYYAGLK